MISKKRIFWFTGLLVFGLLVYLVVSMSGRSTLDRVEVSQDIESVQTEKRTVRDISEETAEYVLQNEKNGQATLKLTAREFPNGDQMIYIEAESADYLEPIEILLPFSGEADLEYVAETPVAEMYSFRKPRSKPDPLTTRLTYIENEENSSLRGPSVYFKDISHTYDNGEESRVMEFMREKEALSIEEDGLQLTVQFEPGEEQFSTWLMLSEEKLLEDEQSFIEIHKIGADEFRWITPDTLWSHGLSTIFPAAETAFVRSLVRQSGRASAVMLNTDPSRFWENINRHHFASLEAARNEDGLWHSDYTSTWLESAYGIGTGYVDSRHNDNIFRSQLNRAAQFGYDSYAEERAVYADFLIAMADEGFVLTEGEGYYLIDYYDFENRTHASLNHALSLMNYQYDAFRHLEDEKYLESAEQQFAAFEETGLEWIDENGEIIYQLKPDGTMSGKDYNLVTYYDLLYTKKLRGMLELPDSAALDPLIETKYQNLLEKGLPIEGDLSNVENFVGLIE